MLEGIKILIEQIESSENTARWRGMVRQVFSPRTDGLGSIFTEEEIEAVRQALVKRERVEFTAEVLSRLSSEYENVLDEDFGRAVIKGEGHLVEPNKFLITPTQLNLARSLLK